MKKFILKLMLTGSMIFAAQLSEARISSLSPWSLQDRLATNAAQIDQSAGYLLGINGVTPTGGDTDAKFMEFPYQITYGLADKAEIGARWGLEWVDRKNKNSQFGISDLAIAGRYRFFDANRAERTPGLDIEAGFLLPTASFDKGLGSGGLGIIVGWGLVLPLDPLRAHFGMGFKYYTENSDDVQVGSIFSYNGGFTLPLKQMKDRLSITGELKGFNHSRNKISGAKIGAAPDELYLAPGAIWKLDQRFEISGALLIGLTTDSSDLGMNFELRF